MNIKDGTGGISLDHITEEALKGPPPSTTGTTINTRFSRAVSKLVLQRKLKEETEEYSVFILSENIPKDKNDIDQDWKFFNLVSNGSDAISGKIILATPNLKNAVEVDLLASNQHEMYSILKTFNIPDTPLIIIDWRGDEPIISYYKSGLNSVNDIETIEISNALLTAAKLKSTLDRFYNRCLISPLAITEGHGTRVWKEASKGIPEFRPEERIQGKLVDALKTTFASKEFRAEPTSIEGRADILIFSHSTDKMGLPATVNEWILELKALCDMTNTGNQNNGSKDENIKEGLEQAISYRKQHNGIQAALCCFDMRKEDLTDSVSFSHILNDAKQEKVLLWRWFLYRSAAKLRASKEYVTRP